MKLDERFKSITGWVKLNWVLLVIAQVCVMIGFLTLVMLSWLYGYWSNALWGTKFELQSCWTGISAVLAGVGSIATMAGGAYAKYYADSRFNSGDGEKPYQAVARDIMDKGVKEK